DEQACDGNLRPCRHRIAAGFERIRKRDGDGQRRRDLDRRLPDTARRVAEVARGALAQGDVLAHAPADWAAAVRMTGACRTGTLHELAMKHSSCASSCSRIASSASSPSAIVTTGASRTSMKRGRPSPRSWSVPLTESSYASTRTPFRAQSARYESR